MVGCPFRVLSVRCDRLVVGIGMWFMGQSEETWTIFSRVGVLVFGPSGRESRRGRDDLEEMRAVVCMLALRYTSRPQ